MKPLSYTQKKWAMATFLVGALTVSASLHTPAKVSQIDLASTDDQVEGNLPTTDGVVKVKYIKNGEEVIAVVPKTVEGKLCDACGKSYNLSIAFDKNKGDLDALNVALLQQIKKNQSSTVETKNKPSRKVRSKVKSEADDRDVLLEAMQSCDADEKVEKVACMAEQFLSEIKGRDEKNRVSQSTAVEVFRQEIEPKISKILSGNHASLVKIQGIQDFDQEMASLLIVMDKMKSTIPEDQSELRKRVFALEKNSINARALALKQRLEQLKANPNDHAGHTAAMQEILYTTKLAEVMDAMNNPYTGLNTGDLAGDMARIKLTQMNGALLNSLQKAINIGHIQPSEALELYKKEYNANVMDILKGIRRSYREEYGRTVVDPDAIVIEKLEALRAEMKNNNPRLNIPTAGTTTRSTLPAGVVNGQGQQIGTPSVPGQVPQQGRTFQGRGF
jgi:hypothetical protein